LSVHAPYLVTAQEPETTSSLDLTGEILEITLNVQ